ncbi:hypothetical protein TCON_2804, partial [Astathelohania contejeani]
HFADFTNSKITMKVLTWLVLLNVAAVYSYTRPYITSFNDNITLYQNITVNENLYVNEGKTVNQDVLECTINDLKSIEELPRRKRSISRKVLYTLMFARVAIPYIRYSYNYYTYKESSSQNNSTIPLLQTTEQPVWRFISYIKKSYNYYTNKELPRESSLQNNTTTPLLQPTEQSGWRFISYLKQLFNYYTNKELPQESPSQNNTNITFLQTTEDQKLHKSRRALFI